MIMDDNYILDLINNRKTKEQGFKLLISKTKEKLYWQIRRMLISHEDTDDLLQEVYIKVFRNISSFKKDSSLSTWIFRIAYNESINFLKSKAKQQKLNDLPLDMAMMKQSPAIQSNDADLIEEILQKAIQTLPDKQREVFLLRYNDNMPFKEMETLLNTSEGALKTSYHIAEKKIKEFFLTHSLNF